MFKRMERAVFAALLIAVIPSTSHAQLGALKKKLKEKAGLETPAENSSSSSSSSGHKKMVQWKPGERIDPLTNESLEGLISAMKRYQAEQTMSEKDREKAYAAETARKEALEKKRDQREACINTLQPEMMELNLKMQQRIIQLAQTGDPQTAAQTAAKEMQAGYLAIVEKKCGPEPKAGPEAQEYNWRAAEWLCAYVAARQEMDPAAAGAMILASDQEIKMLEAHLTALREACADQLK